jgi:hypothetical protein
MSATDIQIAICSSAGDSTIAAGGILNRAMAGPAGHRSTCIRPDHGFGRCIACSRTTQRSHSLKARSDVLISLNDGRISRMCGGARLLAR